MSERATRSDVRDFVKQLLEEITKLSPDDISETSTIDGGLKMESVAFVELQVAIEEHYQIELNPIEVVERNQLGLIIDYIYDLVNAQRDESVSA